MIKKDDNMSRKSTEVREIPDTIKILQQLVQQTFLDKVFRIFGAVHTLFTIAGEINTNFWGIWSICRIFSLYRLI
jgi:hypothetical protein